MRKVTVVVVSVAALVLPASALAGGGVNGTAAVSVSQKAAAPGQVVTISGRNFGPDGAFITGECGPIVLYLRSLTSGGSSTRIGKPKLNSASTGQTSFRFRWTVRGPAGVLAFGRWRIVAVQQCTDPDDDPYTLDPQTGLRIVRSPIFTG